MPRAGEPRRGRTHAGIRLDMAFGLTQTSRLGCQVKVEASMDNSKVVLPKATRNFYVDGHKPTPH